jgi:hypothetical protein
MTPVQALAALVLQLLILCAIDLATAAAASATKAYCTRHSSINATSAAKATPLPAIKLSIVVEKNVGTIELYEGKGSMTVLRGDGEEVWNQIRSFSNNNRDAMIVVVRSNTGIINVHREKLSDDDYYYDYQDREADGPVMEVAHFERNRGLLEISAGTSKALFVVLKEEDTGNSSATVEVPQPDRTEANSSFFAGTVESSDEKPLKSDTCYLYELMGVDSAKCFGCPVPKRVGDTLRRSAALCVHKLSEICDCSVFKRGGLRCFKKVVNGQCQNKMPSANKFFQETKKQYTRYCSNRGKNP